MSTARKTVTFEGQFRMHRAGYLESPTLAYETWGELNAAKDNAVLIFTGLSPSAHATSCAEDPTPGWWEDMIGSGRPIDTDRFFVICVNSLGSCFGSTGPASINPETGKRYRLSFPVLTLEDVAESAWLVVQHLGIDRLHTVVGCSMGGMSGLALCVRHPESTRAFVSISSATRAMPFSIAVRSLQREMIRSDPKWKKGNYKEGKPPITGQRLARKLGMITYRSAEEWVQRFGRERSTTHARIEDQFVAEFAYCLLAPPDNRNLSGSAEPFSQHPLTALGPRTAKKLEERTASEQVEVGRVNVVSRSPASSVLTVSRPFALETKESPAVEATGSPSLREPAPHSDVTSDRSCEAQEGQKR